MSTPKQEVGSYIGVYVIHTPDTSIYASGVYKPNVCVTAVYKTRKLVVWNMFVDITSKYKLDYFYNEEGVLKDTIKPPETFGITLMSHLGHLYLAFLLVFASIC
jgi:hypothetical protein